MSAGMVVMNYCSGVAIRRAHSWEIPAYEREVARTADGPGDAGVIDGEALSPTLAGLRVILVPDETAPTAPTSIAINGRTLSVLPINMTLPEFRENCRAHTVSVLVYEPGDLTRYMLIVAPLKEGNRWRWLVSRCQGGYSSEGPQVGATVISADFDGEPLEPWMLLDTIANKNGHSAEVLSAALNVLLESIQ